MIERYKERREGNDRREGQSRWEDRAVQGSREGNGALPGPFLGCLEQHSGPAASSQHQPVPAPGSLGSKAALMREDSCDP